MPESGLRATAYARGARNRTTPTRRTRVAPCRRRTDDFTDADAASPPSRRAARLAVATVVAGVVIFIALALLPAGRSSTTQSDAL